MPARWLWLLQRHGPAIFCGVAGFLGAFTIPLGGRMPLGELLLLAAFPWIIVKAFHRRGWSARIQQLGWYQLLLVLAGITVLGYGISDLYRETAFENVSRGWARVAFLGIDLVVIAHFIDAKWSRLQTFVLALLLGGTAHALVEGPLFDEWWKFGFGYSVTALALFSLAGRGPALQVTAAAGLGLLNLALGARSLGAICLLTGAFFGISYARGIWRPLALLGSVGVTTGLLVAAHFLVLEDQQHAGSNIERQSMVETAVDAFIDSPLIGQGSWFTATGAIRRLEDRRLLLEPGFRGYSEEEARQLAIHSQLLVALAEGGLLGGAFFFGLAALVAKSLRSLTLVPVPHRAFVLYVVLNGGWNLLMSPFSGVARVEIVLLVCTGLLVILERQGEQPEDFRE